jgi:hypothetical protein
MRLLLACYNREGSSGAGAGCASTIARSLLYVTPPPGPNPMYFEHEKLPVADSRPGTAPSRSPACPAMFSVRVELPRKKQLPALDPISWTRACRYEAVGVRLEVSAVNNGSNTTCPSSGVDVGGGGRSTPFLSRWVASCGME